jgi:hypothetical protein
MSTAEALAQTTEADAEDAPTADAGATFAPGVRLVDGSPMYSAAWIDFDALTPAPR